MKNIAWSFLALAALVSSCNNSNIGSNNETASQAPENAQKTNIIFDTDFCFDVDDVGALSILHAMSDMGEANIKGIVYNEVDPLAAPALDAINTWYHSGDIPIGIYKEPLDNPDTCAYTPTLSQMDHSLDMATIPSALEVYHKLLTDAPDQSITIVSVGFMNNLSDLIDAYPNLVRTKVKKMIVMGGIDGDDFNFVRHNLASDTQNVFEKWPTPIVISQLGGDVLTGDELGSTPKANPVREAFYLWFDHSFKGRPSWDELTTLYAVRPDEFQVKSTGTFKLANGYTFDMKAGWREWIDYIHDKNYYKSMINSLMALPPKSE